jgi:type IV secretion system protein VirB4
MLKIFDPIIGSLKIFRQKPDFLYDILPWDMLMTKSERKGVPEGVVCNKDGSYQKTFEFRGPDMDSATKEEIDMMIVRLNNVYKRLGGYWCLYAEAQRQKAMFYPESNFPDAVTQLIDEERKNYFLSGNHYESKMYLTLCWKPAKGKIKKMERFFIRRSGRQQAGKQHTKYDEVREFLKSFYEFFELFREVMNYARELTDDETLTYLHSTVSPYRHNLVRSRYAIKLDQYIYDAVFVGGFEPKLDDTHIRSITVQGYPEMSVPGMFDQLNRLPFEYRWITRFIALEPEAAKGIAKKVEKEAYRGRVDLITFITAQFSPDSTVRYDNNALEEAEAASEAHDAVASNRVSYGYMTTTIVLMDKDMDVLAKKVQEVQKVINNRGFTCYLEKINAPMAWAGAIPCNPYANVKKPILSSENLADLFPFSSIWAGEEKNRYYNVPSLIYTQTSGSTPWRLNLHAYGGDVGHTAVLGPTGSGKSVLLGTIIAQFRKYAGAKIVVFDKDASTRVLCYATGGQFYDLNVDGGALAFQPFARIHEPEERVWAAEWLKRYLTAQGVDVTAAISKKVDDGLAALATDKPKNRNITGFSVMVADKDVRAAIAPLKAGGLYGSLFDARQEVVSDNHFQVFEMGKLMEKSILPQALEYLFHYVNRIFKVRETAAAIDTEQSGLKLLVLDECWKFLKDPTFANQIEDWLKTLRKFNVSVVFATQDIADIVKSPIKDTIINNCLTKIYLPNANAIQENIYELYESFGLNRREINTIAAAIPKREYYYKCGRDSRKFELAMGRFALAFIAASDVEQQETAIRLYQENPERFVQNWLAYRRLGHEYELYQKYSRRKGEEKEWQTTDLSGTEKLSQAAI